MPKAKNAKGPISHLLVPEMDWIQQSCKRRFIMGFTTLCVCVSCLAGPCELFACSFLGRWAVLSKHIKAIHSISKPTFPVFLLFQGEAPHFLMIMLQAAHLWNQKLKRTKLDFWSFEHPLRYFCCIFGFVATGGLEASNPSEQLGHYRCWFRDTFINGEKNVVCFCISFLEFDLEWFGGKNKTTSE